MPKALPGNPDEKAWGTSMLDIGISIGSLLIIPIVTALAENFGWRNTFRCVGAASLCFVGLWVFVASSTPAECWFMTKQELAYLDASVSVSPKCSKPSYMDAKASSTLIGMPYSVAFHPGLWALFAAHMAFNFGAYYLTNWSPTYYNDVLGMAPSKATLLVSWNLLAEIVFRYLVLLSVGQIGRAHPYCLTQVV